MQVDFGEDDDEDCILIEGKPEEVHFVTYRFFLFFLLFVLSSVSEIGHTGGLASIKFGVFWNKLLCGIYTLLVFFVLYKTFGIYKHCSFGISPCVGTDSTIFRIISLLETEYFCSFLRSHRFLFVFLGPIDQDGAVRDRRQAEAALRHTDTPCAAHAPPSRDWSSRGEHPEDQGTDGSAGEHP